MENPTVQPRNAPRTLDSGVLPEYIQMYEIPGQDPITTRSFQRYQEDNTHTSPNTKSNRNVAKDKYNRLT